MSIRINAGPRSIEITNDDGAYCDLDINPDGSFEIGSDNGKDSWGGENRCCHIQFSPEDAPMALLAITNWIESLNKEAPAS